MRARNLGFSAAAWFAMAGGTILLAGCGSHAEIVLQQSFAPPAQRHLALEAEQAYHAASSGRHACVLTFPLPGSDVGPRAYVMYFSVPSSTGYFAIHPGDPDGARGFLIQEIGSLAGRTDFAGGSIELKKRWMSAGTRKVVLDVRCLDGTKISGEAIATYDPGYVRVLEREYADDVALLTMTQPRTGSDAQPSDVDDEPQDEPDGSGE
jgi:hypothetical protein